MHIPASKRVTVVLALFCTGLLALSCCFFWNYVVLRIRVAFASEQIQMFEEMRLRDRQTDLSEAVGHLKDVVSYYPSGTKQKAGSSLDSMVERERQHAVNEIMVYLREKTGEDLGKDPDVWIQRYGRK